ncbi:MAG: VIT1/CCC1 transporter family protein [Candidatus Nanoarchaeia archaeon]|jgi:predicted membrane protein (TIGR00267 family)|nr:VIT1/CCC1 transporter family protein [Candidatus Nanoarchaeia archaeon]|tara:strand:+ start:2855 stop:3364 length:510 start_codon:yes stop_codon:yes gene_type:complete
MTKQNLLDNLRQIVFGVEDGAIGNLGVVVGMAQAAAPNSYILLAGIATMFAQMISMSAGTYLSVKSESEYLSSRKGARLPSHKHPINAALIMGISVIIGAAIPLSAFLIWENTAGIIPAICITLLGLFVLGAYKGTSVKKNPMKSGIEMSLIGGLAALAGFLIGNFFTL